MADDDGNPIGDTDIDEDGEAAADQLLSELHEAGFEFGPSGRLEGISREDGEGTGEGEAEDAPDAGEGDTGADDGGSAAGGDDGSGSGGDAGNDDGAGDAGTAAGARAGLINVAGTELPESEAKGLLFVRQALMDNPDLAESFGAMLEAKRQGKPLGDVVAAGKEAEPKEEPLPDFIDADNPTEVGLWRELQEVRAAATGASQQVTQSVENQSRERMQQQINSAVSAFAGAHPDLSPDEIAQVRLYTKENVNVPGVMANYPDDPIAGILKCFEIGSMTDPAVRDKVLGNADAGKQQRAAEDGKRTRALSALSGTSGSGSRRAPAAPKPKTWNDVVTELAKGIESGG